MTHTFNTSRDFVAELKRICSQFKEPVKEQAREPEVKRYNIHKRSLPVGIDIKVVVNVVKEEAEWWLENRLKPKCYQNEPEDTKTLIYYDVIPVDATPEEKNVYHNSGALTTEPILEFCSPRRIN